MSVRRIFVEASITARPFFEKQGFHVVRKNDLVVRGAPTTNLSTEKRLPHPEDHYVE